jgi:uncharacterized protein (TIGR00297 family)
LSAHTLAAWATSALVAVVGRQTGALTGRGAVAATFVGGTAISALGWRAAALLGSFFVSGSILSRVTPRTQTGEAAGERNERQVLANGGAAAVAALVSPLAGRDRAYAALAGSLAAATADTWATEIGSTSSRSPRLILSGKPVPAGMSGGVTARGNVAALAGALSIGALASVAARSGRLGMAVALAGMAGSTIDSLLGELIQVRRRDPATGELTEADAVDGVPTGYYSGWSWVDNDLVNFACTWSGALIALALYELAGGPPRRPSLAPVAGQPPVGHGAD